MNLPHHVVRLGHRLGDAKMVGEPIKMAEYKTQDRLVAYIELYNDAVGRALFVHSARRRRILLVFFLRLIVQVLGTAPVPGPGSRLPPGPDLGREVPVGTSACARPAGHFDLDPPMVFRVGRPESHEGLPCPHERVVILGVSQGEHHAQVGGCSKDLSRTRSTKLNQILSRVLL